MNVVVERGVARCPRCVAVAEYSFTECGSDYVRYEIRCPRCSEVYIEVNSTGPTAFRTDVEQYVYSRPSRDHETLHRVIDELGQRWSTVAAAAMRHRRRRADALPVGESTGERRGYAN